MKDALKLVAGIAWLILIACTLTLELLGESSSYFGMNTSQSMS